MRHAWSKVWLLLRQALGGAPLDLTELPIGRAVLLLAVPMVMEMSMESLFAIVDIFWVSKLGASAVAVVGLTEALLSMMYAVAMGLSMGATAVVARRIGEDDPDGAAEAALHAVLLAALASLVIAVLGVGFGRNLLQLMGADAAVVERGTSYVRLMLGGNLSIMLLFVLNAIFRGAGDATIAMRSLWLANLANIVLGPCFIFGVGPLPALGVRGAALATNLGRSLGVGFQLLMLMRGASRVRPRLSQLRIVPAVFATMLRVAGTGTLQILVETASWLGLVRILSSFGSAALAGYTIAMRVAIFALLPSWGMANAAATLVGQNLGAKQPERAEQSVWVAARYNFFFLGIVSVLFVAFPEPLVRLFSQDPQIVLYAHQALRIVALGFLFFAYGMVLTQAFNGAGDTRTPTLINLAGFWGFKIPVAYWLAVVLKLGPVGVFYAITLAYSTMALVAAAVFKRGAWKVARV